MITKELLQAREQQLAKEYEIALAQANQIAGALQDTRSLLDIVAKMQTVEAEHNTEAHVEAMQEQVKEEDHG